MNVISRLARVDLFSSLSDEELRLVASIVKRVRYRRGYRICRQGQPCTSLYIFDSGEAIARAADEFGVEKPVGYYKPGHTLGEALFLRGKPWEATVEATTDVELLRIEAHDFELLLSASPQIADKLGQEIHLPTPPRAPRFSWQEPGEHVVWFGHRHKYVLLSKVAGPIVVAVFLLAVFVTIEQRGSLAWAVFSFLLVLCAFWLGWQWIDWANDYFVVTNRRVVHRELGLLQREERREAPLDKIQNVNVVRTGPLARILGFGKLIIATASMSGGLVFDPISKPEEARESIFEQINRSKAWAKASGQDEIRRELAQRLGRAGGGSSARVATQAPRPPVGGISAKGARTRRPLFAIRIEEGDNVIWRKYWIVLDNGISKPITIGAALLVLALLPFDRFSPTAKFVTDYDIVPLYIAVVCTVIFTWLAYEYADWRNDLYMVTPDRIVDMEKSPFRLRETRREASLANIQNVGYTRPGFLANILNYGKVVIETAGQTGSFEFYNVADPAGVQRDIFEYTERYRERQRQAEERRLREQLGDWIEAYDSLR